MFHSSGTKAWVVYSDSFDPWYNLALEEYLLRKVQRGQVILYLWQNKDTVVIGRNQNPWKECRCRQLEEEGGKLARRLSGGGAVFHDTGNLNFTFVVDRALYDLDRQLGVILDAVRKLGIEARFTGRNDLTVDGRKFSGNAFYFSKTGAIHHGTLLIDCRLSKLQRYLQVSKEKIISKGIESVRARVINLKEIRGDLTVDQMKESLEASFAESYGGGQTERLDIEDNEDIRSLNEKYASWEWRYGDTPRFDVVFEERFPWGGLELGLSLGNAVIQKSVIYSDAMDAELIQKLAASLQGVPFRLEDMDAALSGLSASAGEEEIIQEVKAWLRRKMENL